MISKLLIAFLLVCTAYSAYDQSLARNICSYGAITHCDNPVIQSWNCKLCNQIQKLQDVVVIQNKSTSIFGFIGFNTIRNRIVVIWRGSVDTENWIQDFNFEKVPYAKCKNCQVHAGFELSYLSVESTINDLVTKYLAKHPTANITVGGHSLGGALAMYSALSLQLKFNKVTELYTLGQPRLGNAQFAQFVSTKIPNIYRLIHNKDIVPHVPFEWLEYHHSAYEVFYDADMKKYTICNSSGQDQSCSNKFYPDYSMPDHDFYFVNEDTSAC